MTVTPRTAPHEGNGSRAAPDPPAEANGASVKS
jgi:hypothetical protein